MITKIAASRDRLYALDDANKLWFCRSSWGWEHIAGPVDAMALPLILVDAAFGSIRERDGTVEYLYVLTHEGQVFMQDYTARDGWRDMGVPK